MFTIPYQTPKCQHGLTKNWSNPICSDFPVPRTGTGTDTDTGIPHGMVPVHIFQAGKKTGATIWYGSGRDWYLAHP